MAFLDRRGAPDDHTLWGGIVRLGGPDGWDEDENGGARAHTPLRSASPAGGASEHPLVLAFSCSLSSTALALFRGGEPVRSETVLHDVRELAKARRPEAQRELRTRTIREFLAAAAVSSGALSAVAVHADTLRPVETGTYRIDAVLLRDAECGCRNLAACVAHDIATEWRCPALAVDPCGSDERGAADAKNGGSGERPVVAMKAAARRHALAVARPLESLRLVLVYLGDTVSVCVQSGARIGEVHEVLDALAVANGLALALDGVEAGDARASGVLHSAASRIAQVIGGLATVLEGELDAVVVTGELGRTGAVLGEICRRVEWIAPVFLYRDEDALVALANGAMAVLRGDEPLKQYA